MAEFVLQVQDIDDRGKDYEFPLPAAWLESALVDTPLKRDPGADPGRLAIHAQRNGAEIFVKGDVEADLLVECSRCLRDVPLHVHGDMAVLLGRGQEPDEEDGQPEDFDRATFEGHEVVLDELVREHLLLELPMQPLCATDCPGIPIPERVKPDASDFGGPGKVDPRLLPLQQLRARLSSDKE